MENKSGLLKKLENTNEIIFVIVIALIALAIKIPGTIIGDLLLVIFNLNRPPFISDLQIPEITIIDFISSIIIAPPLETVLGQLLPILIVSKFTNKNSIKIIISAIVFALWHLPVLGFLPGAFLIGVVFSWALIVKLNQSRFKAFFLVTLSHLLHNLIAFSLAYFLPIQ